MSTRFLTKLTVITSAALAIGLGGGYLAKRALSAPDAPAWFTSDWLTSAPTNDAAQVLAPANPMPAVRPVAVRLPAMSTGFEIEAAVMLGGDVRNAFDGPVALPHGAQFQLRVGAGQSGHLTVQAINPNGVIGAKPLWEGTVWAGQQIVTPQLRLTRTRGVETLRLTLTSAADGEVGSRDVQLLHL